MKLKNTVIAVLCTLPLCHAHAVTLPSASQTEQINKVRKGTLNIRTAPNAAVSIQQKKHDFVFGTAVDHTFFTQYDPLDGRYIPEADRQQYLTILKNNFNHIVQEYGHKWTHSEKEQDQMRDMTDVHASVNWALNNGMSHRGHTLFWSRNDEPGYIQPWVQALDNTTLLTEMQERVSDILTPYKGKIKEWDVNNEMLAGNYYGDRFGNTIHKDMFDWAKQIDPDLTLYTNEYGVTEDTAYNLWPYVAKIRELQAMGTQLGGIGSQAHVGPREPAAIKLNPLDTRTGLAVLSHFNLPIKITEFDVNTTDEAMKEESLVNMYSIAFANPQVDGVVMWGFWEKKHWRPAAALWKIDWSITPAAQSYQNLVYNLWWTNLNATTNSSGLTSQEVFYGDHNLSINGGAAQTVSMTRKEGNKTIDLVSGTSVSMPSPMDDSVYMQGDSIQVSANAVDAGGSVSKVGFYKNGVLLAEDTTAPYSFQWNNVAAGDYELTARAYDNSGNATDTPVTRIRVNSQPLANNRWALDETTGTTAVNTGGSLAGTIVGADRVAGKAGNALSFDGLSQDRVDFSSNFATSGPLTVSAWVMPTVAPDGTGRVIVGTYDWNATASLVRGWNLGNTYGSTDRLTFNIFDSNGQEVRAIYNGFFNQYKDQWVHLTGVFKPGEHVALYINGEIVGLQATDVTSIAYNTTTLRIGARADYSDTAMWAGLIDDVKLWNTALTPREIKTEATGSAALPPVAGFSANQTSGLAPLNVQFTDSSSGNISSWAWDFNNDGVVDSTAQNPVYSYTTPGSYTVKLTVNAQDGQSDVEAKTNLITVNAADTIPNAFSFTDVTGANLSSVYTSNAITVAGINAPSTISITGGEYQINGGAWTSASATVVAGNTVAVRLTSAATGSTASNATLNIGGVADTYSVTTKLDNVPNAFSFVDVVGANLNTYYISNKITVSGMDTGATATISRSGSGSFRINGGAWRTSSTTVKAGDVVEARVLTSKSSKTAVAVTINMGGITDEYRVTTK